MYHLRDLSLIDIPSCQEIVAEHWGIKIADNAVIEMEEMFSGTRWPPHYYVVEDEIGVVGFGGFTSTRMMSNTFELIWVNVHPRAIGKGVGTMLTRKRLTEIRRRGGNLVFLMTRKSSFFVKFGFRAVANFDGLDLMVNQFAPVAISGDN